MVPRYFESPFRENTEPTSESLKPRKEEAGRFQWLMVSVSPQVLAFCVFDICFVHGWAYWTVVSSPGENGNKLPLVAAAWGSAELTQSLGLT